LRTGGWLGSDIPWVRFLCASVFSRTCNRSLWLKQPWSALAHTFYPTVKFDSLVFIEPMLLTARHFKALKHDIKLHEIALARRDFWESKEEALTSFSTKGMKSWDKRVMKLFVVRIPPTSLRPCSALQDAHFDIHAGVWPSGDDQG
jgi:hypothetical protein